MPPKSCVPVLTPRTSEGDLTWEDKVRIPDDAILNLEGALSPLSVLTQERRGGSEAQTRRGRARPETTGMQPQAKGARGHQKLRKQEAFFPPTFGKRMTLVTP